MILLYLQEKISEMSFWRAISSCLDFYTSDILLRSGDINSIREITKLLQWFLLFSYLQILLLDAFCSKSGMSVTLASKNAITWNSEQPNKSLQASKHTNQRPYKYPKVFMYFIHAQRLHNKWMILCLTIENCLATKLNNCDSFKQWKWLNCRHIMRLSTAEHNLRIFLLTFKYFRRPLGAAPVFLWHRPAEMPYTRSLAHAFF